MTTAIQNSITKAELISLLEVASRGGAFFATIETRTVPAMTKTCNPYVGNVVKLARVNVCGNFIYGSAVNRQRVREGAEPDFTAHPRKWGQRIAGTCFVEKEGQLYFEYKEERVLSKVYETLDGQVIPEDALRLFLRDRDEGRAQGLDKAVRVRDPKIESIGAITLAGNRYEVRPEAVA